MNYYWLQTSIHTSKVIEIENWNENVNSLHKAKKLLTSIKNIFFWAAIKFRFVKAIKFIRPYLFMKKNLLILWLLWSLRVSFLALFNVISFSSANAIKTQMNFLLNLEFNKIFTLILLFCVTKKNLEWNR